MNNEQVALEVVGGFTTVVVALLFSLDGEAYGEWTIFIMIIVGILFKRKGNVSWKK